MFLETLGWVHEPCQRQTPGGPGSPTRRAQSADGPYAGIVFNRPIDQIFSYRVPARLQRRFGRVSACGSRWGGATSRRSGIACRLMPRPHGDRSAQGQGGHRRPRQPASDQCGDARTDAARMAGYYACSWGQALDAVVPAGVKNQARGRGWGRFWTVPDEIRNSLETLQLPIKQAEAAWPSSAGRMNLLTVADLCRLAKCASGPITRPPAARVCAYGQAAALQGCVQRLEIGGTCRGLRRRSRFPRVLTGEQTAVMASLTPAPAERRRVRDLLDPRGHRQRQDRGLPERDRAGRGAGVRRSSSSPRST